MILEKNHNATMETNFNYVNRQILSHFTNVTLASSQCLFIAS